ncbi:hypothetical protein AGLY_007589 [Aphis glycines]|uniref:Uncharacterized protein n=1 Tax=Aphis glycines TaxID=307491 RepID=A0A6G0TMM0_APHGL|nr:hypothetical protein AGLY_007589 [Aphis glycines]
MEVFKVRSIVKLFKSDNRNGEDSKTPESSPDDDQTNNKSVLKKVIEDLSRSSKPENPSFFGCRRYMDLAGKVAVITGGTKGIGLAVAKDLIQNGTSRVIISGRDIQEGGKALKILTDMCSDKDDGYQKAIYVPTDVTSKEGLKELFNYTATNMGGLNILVNSAAILNESSMWRRMVDTNVKALILSTQLGIDLMQTCKRPGGVIVNLSAIYAIKPLPQLPIFSGTKAAVRSATLAFSKMKYPNLRIVTACMGPTNTSMLLNLSSNDIGEWTKDEQEDLLDILKAKQNVDYAGRCITLMMQFADNGSTYLVFNNSLHRTKNQDDTIFRKKMMQKFTKSED